MSGVQALLPKDGIISMLSIDGGKLLGLSQVKSISDLETAAYQIAKE
jgi:hypothetical protein